MTEGLLPEGFMDRLTYSDEELPKSQVPPPLQPGDVVKVARSVRWSTDLDGRVKAAAANLGVTMSELIREFAEAGLAEIENDRQVSLADLRRLLASLPPASAA
jgi:predicted DNA-binding protein